MNYKLTVEYAGTNYHGWQIQPNCVSIQAILERAVATFVGAPTRLVAAGRTDAGVHALGQVVCFHTGMTHQPFRICRALNALTPIDVTIKEVEVVGEDFDPRRDARSRTYEYHILNRPTPSPFLIHRAWHLHEPLDVVAMDAALSCLIGEHDYSSFRAAGCDAAHAVRTVYRAALGRRDELLVFTIEATAFLRHMVRNVVGSLAQVGRGERDPDSFRELLQLRDRTKAGETAPAHGLYLTAVRY